ncbi:succinyl-diaminopimelate desuccinylase [Emcibacter sp. SYSU 3D8]|uniref:succinyl-diaminopimelate desuccinylase n=1 Tax=Emcibacter sp. SYSU 3D8 TaxID=3133969 RepID=UPI0031FF243E
MAGIDPIKLTQELIRCPSVTPADAGALDVLQRALEQVGFVCRRYVFSEEGTPDIDNLYARLGTALPNFCFAGHTDVVPVGDLAGWTVDPFGAEIIDGVLFGRGAADMKAAIACFAAAAGRFAEAAPGFPGSISLLITGDEEGPSINGTRKVLEALREEGEQLTHCLVGEPTNPIRLGDMAKIGRRGSLNGLITVNGVQGHVAYPHLADNPAPRLVRLMTRLAGLELDRGNAHFQASNLEITAIETSPGAENVIPAWARCRFNVRFNSDHSSQDVERLVRHALDHELIPYDLAVKVSGESFLTPPGKLSRLVVDACKAVLGREPELSTTGGTSDARFIKDYCPVIEFGMASGTMHKVDERVAVSDIDGLTTIYEEVLRRYFAG